MTDREKAIVMAYTGAVMLTGEKLSVYYEYVGKILGRPAFTHDFLFCEKQIRERSREDFIKLCEQTQDDITPVVRCKDCKHRRTDKCPMHLNELAYCDEGRGGYSVYMQTKDKTSDDGFCHLGVRMDGDAHG